MTLPPEAVGNARLPAASAHGNPIRRERSARVRAVRVLRVAFSVLLFGTGCATLHPPSGGTPQANALSPETIEADARLGRMNDEELFAEGTAALGAGDFERAGRMFDRLVDAFPKSRHWRSAVLQAGVCDEHLKRWDAARERFSAIADPTHGTGEALDAAFRLAEVDYQRNEYAAPALLLGTLADREDLPLERRIEARVQEGICEVEAGELDRAETTLRQALTAWQHAPHPQDLDKYFPAQAEFFLGEIYRLHEEEVSLDPDQTADELGKQLEYKAELLLSAQGHYLRAIRVGDGYWATAAGAEVGALYEGLYRYLVDAPTPKELNPAETDVYRQEVRKKIRVLLTKAISIYESTLDAAERLGTQGPFVEKSRAGLERLKALLMSEDSDTPPPATPPAGSRPVRHPDSLEPHSARTPPSRFQASA